MIDIELIKKEPEELYGALRKRDDEIDFDPIIDADRKRRTLIIEIEGKRAERKQIAKGIGERRGRDEDASELESTATSLRDSIAALAQELDTEEGRLRELLMELPNIPDERVPA